MGISSRGIGDMELREGNGEKYYEVLPGYTYVTWDAVSDPSVSGATLTVMEHLNKKVKPIQEAKKRSSNLLDKQEYERLLVEAVHDYFGTTPMNRIKKAVRKSFFV